MIPYANDVNLFCFVTQMYAIVNLADELLPPLPVGTISLPVYAHVYMKGSSVKKSASSKQGEPGSTENELSGREKLLHDQPELLQQFGMDLLPTMIQVRSQCCCMINVGADMTLFGLLQSKYSCTFTRCMALVLMDQYATNAYLSLGS
jgi:hypothetical protein